MIWESCHWKEPLLKERKYLSQFRATQSTKESTFAGIEKRIFISFYAIRKLIEADKLTTAYLSLKWKITKYPNTELVDIMNWHKINRKYDLSKETHETRDLEWICNQIIHSFVFIPIFRESGLFDGAYVSSDRNKNRCVYYFTRKLMFDLFELIGNDYPSASQRVRGEDGQWITENYDLPNQEVEPMLKTLVEEFEAQSSKAHL